MTGGSYRQKDFDCGTSIASDERLLPALELDARQMFFKLVTKTRRQKKPLLLLVVSNPDDESQIDSILQILGENAPAALAIIKNNFNLFVVS